MSNMLVKAIPAFHDNYIWCIHDKSKAIVIDPGQAEPVTAYLSQNDLTLTTILVTHHHPDHIGGISELKRTFSEAEVIGFSGARYPQVELTFSHGDKFERLGLSFEVLEVPGHTLDHIAFVSIINGRSTLFCGDTLFSGGCGRLFEGSAEQMYTSLKMLRNLPAETEIYCAHEYTLANLSFARTLMPANADLQQYIEQCRHKREQGLSTIPTTLDTELKINPFLRESDPEIIDNLRKLDYQQLDTECDRFAAIRVAKDRA